MFARRQAVLLQPVDVAHSPVVDDPIMGAHRLEQTGAVQEPGLRDRQMRLVGIDHVVVEKDLPGHCRYMLSTASMPAKRALAFATE